MAFSRYQRDRVQLNGKALGISRAISAVRFGIKRKEIGILRIVVSTQADRLDTLAGSFYGDGRYWWVLAAASNVGWGLQIPPGTLIQVPDLKDVEKLVG